MTAYAKAYICSSSNGEGTQDDGSYCILNTFMYPAIAPHLKKNSFIC